MWQLSLHKSNAANERLADGFQYGRIWSQGGYVRPKFSHSNSLGNNTEKDKAGCCVPDRKSIVIGRLVEKEDFLYGFRRFSVGLFKKVWIADILAQTADTVFLAQTAELVPIDCAWIGAIAYTFQIFFDLSAYSDMAIGMLAIMGFHVGENSNQPYTALSVTDFWKRWHISMTSWFREYLYIPLGGNRKGTARTYLNLWIVFLLSGFWHGAALNFIFWGAYHGFLLCIERGGLLKRMEKVPGIIRVMGTFLLVMIRWIFFRVDTIGQGFSYLANLFNPVSYYTHLSSKYILTIEPRECFIFALAAVICFLPVWKGAYGWIERKARSLPTLCHIGILILFFWAAMKVITGAISPAHSFISDFKDTII